MPPTPPDAAVCSEVEITGCFHPSPSPRAALVFRFTHEDGTVLVPIVLTLSDIVMLTLSRLIGRETVRAVLAARQVRALS